jgi:hypothetical protein
MPNTAIEHLKFEFPELEGNERLRELILYISQKCSADPTFCATKLNKLLFYSDFLSYFRFGEPIAGLEYQRLPHGPAPKQLVPVREAMIKDGDLILQKVPFYDKQQHRCVPMRDPDLGKFKGRDIALIDALIQSLWAKTATEVSEISHQRAWRIAKDRESIPYEAIFLSDDDDLTDAELAHLKALNQEHGWE